MIHTTIQNHPKQGIRDGFGDGLLQAGKNNPKVIALSADLTASCKMDTFAKAFPKRFIQVGVAEQNMVGIAAGLAHTGLQPFIGSFAAFCPGRTFDQIRVSVCYANNNVKIYGGHAGLTVGEDGATHQMCEDLSLMTSLPNMTVFVPCDYNQAYKGTLQLAHTTTPAYIRGSRAQPHTITTLQQELIIGKADTVIDHAHPDITIFACGIMVQQAIIAAQHLHTEHINVCVINIHTLKPLDTQAIINASKKSKLLITAEEHQINGGLFSAVAQTLSQHNPKKIIPIAVQDTFGESGKADALLEKYGLTAHHIIQTIQKHYKHTHHYVH